MSGEDILKSKELTLCGNCKRPFNSLNLEPKYLACKHYFCLECIQRGFSSQSKPHEIYCPNCWKLTDLSEGGAESLETFEPALALANYFHKLMNGSIDSTSNGVNGAEIEHFDTEMVCSEVCHVHSMPLKLWCINCSVSLCHKCANQEHSDNKNHNLWTDDVAKTEMAKQANTIITAIATMDDHIQRLSLGQRQFLILVRNALAAIEQDVQSNLDNLESQWSIDPGAAEIRRFISRTEVLLKDTKTPTEVHNLLEQLLTKQNFLKGKYQDMIFVCKMNDLVRNAVQVFNFDTLRLAVNSIIEGNETTPIQQPGPDPILFLANYFLSQLYSRSVNMNSTRVPPEAVPAQLFNGSLPEIPVNAVASSLNDHVSFLQNNVDYSMPIQESIQNHPSTSPTHPSFTPPLDVADHLSVASSATPQRINSPPLTLQQDELRISPTPRTSSAQMYPIESTDFVEYPQVIQPQARMAKPKPLINPYPRYFFNIEFNGSTRGRFVIETRPDVAPKMCRNFDRLATQDGKVSYKGCVFFQCWKGESVITGDFEYNNGRGGKSIYEDNFFQPDETRFPAIRGAVGMRRQQKSHENSGLVGSVFRILLQDMQGFSGIFGHVVDGLELIDKIASYGDTTGKPMRMVKITGCGKLESK